MGKFCEICGMGVSYGQFNALKARDGDRKSVV